MRKFFSLLFECLISISLILLQSNECLSQFDGIPQKIVDKIFQTFFTTKSTGQGTGLGLSLSYDIIKAHGGEIRVETKEGNGSEFVIELPVKS
jgi:C4-dicarboxylate-specific signal transduction histidine kinase